MTLPRRGSYRKDTCHYHYDEYKAIQFMLNKLEGRMIEILRGYGITLLTRQFISYSLIKQFAYP